MSETVTFAILLCLIFGGGGFTVVWLLTGNAEAGIVAIPVSIWLGEKLFVGDR